jgi:hypothetical protein
LKSTEEGVAAGKHVGHNPEPFVGQMMAFRQVLERAKGIEPSYAAWEAAVLPLNYARALEGN